MILTCPSCATSYFTPDEAIGPNGRMVRCRDCKHTWRASLDEPLELSQSPPAIETRPTSAAAVSGAAEPTSTETLAETPAPELPKAFRARAEQQRKLRRAAAHGAVWAGVASIFIGLLGAAWLFRVEVVELAPRTATAYAAVGLEVNPTGLDFEAISAKPLAYDPGKVVVSGALRNMRDDERVAPPVRVALLDESGAEIGHAVVRIDAAPVLPGKVQGFAAVIPDPGARGRGVGVDFLLEAPAPRQPAKDAEPAAEHHAASDGHRALPAADKPELRPALSRQAPHHDLPAVDAVPAALDSHAEGAVSARHG